MDGSTCDTSNEYDGKLGLRISAIFVILLGSACGALFPVFAARNQGKGVPKWIFFIAKYFGSGVIVATAFIHLLAPAHEALTNPCLTGPITEYAWVEGICLMAIFVLFFVELMTMRFAKFGHEHGQPHERGAPVKVSESEPSIEDAMYEDKPSSTEVPDSALATPIAGQMGSLSRRDAECPTNPYIPGDDHLSHARDHLTSPHEDCEPGRKTFDPESYGAQLTAIFILEFGVIFHSVFIGLTLAVAGAEFITLYIVLCFHQTFEGLALGSRLASIDWEKNKRHTPYLMCLGYAISTPIAIAVGLALRGSFTPGSQSTLIVNGVFDSISAGILIYTGLVELMAHEFMFSSTMQQAPIAEVLSAVGCMALGATLMALLGKWA